jgi:hypothetical protein
VRRKIAHPVCEENFPYLVEYQYEKSLVTLDRSARELIAQKKQLYSKEIGGQDD